MDHRRVPREASRVPTKYRAPDRLLFFNVAFTYLALPPMASTLAFSVPLHILILVD